jgi:uncharacterized protein (TIGR02996 family)
LPQNIRRGPITTELDLFFGVVESPDDLDRYRVYADFLEDQGDPRAEFMRLAMEMHFLFEERDRLLDGLHSRKRFPAPQRRFMKEKVAALWEEWEGLLPRSHRLEESWRRSWQGAWAAAGCACRLLEHPRADINQHLGIPVALFIRFGQIPDADAVALAACPYLALMTGLDFQGNDIGPARAAALARSPHILALRGLDLRNNRITDEAAPAPASLGHVRLLRVRGNDLGRRGQEAIWRRRRRAGRHRLLGVTPIWDEMLGGSQLYHS